MAFLKQFMTDNDFALVRKLLYLAIIIFLAFILIKVLKKVNHRFFTKVASNKKSLHAAFFEKFINGLIIVAVVIIAVSAFAGAKSVWTTILGGTSVLLAVVTFAAQDVIKDVIAGLMISMYKPFDIGDRVELENKVSGIVEDITMRHVVIRGADTMREVIPNHVINSMSVTNCSYGHDLRSIRMSFAIGYRSDVDLAKKVLSDVIRNCENTCPAPGAKGEYPPVRFASYGDSALLLKVTVYFIGTATENMTDEINSKVKKAFDENGIEIPYSYINVVSHDKMNT